jgi:putative ABC transport system permease protein
LVGDYLLPLPTWEQHAAQRIDSQVLVALQPGANLSSALTEVTRAAVPYGSPRVQDLGQFRASATAGVNTILGLVYVMLALAILIALMGIANTLSLSIHERSRELGLLRAVGQTRSQTRSMVRWESVMISIFGTLGGIALGTFLGWGLVRASAVGSGSALSAFAAPPAQLALFMVVGALAGVLAGTRPARRAARLDVLAAISHD